MGILQTGAGVLPRGMGRIKDIEESRRNLVHVSGVQILPISTRIVLASTRMLRMGRRSTIPALGGGSSRLVRGMTGTLITGGRGESGRSGVFIGAEVNDMDRVDLENLAVVYFCE